MAFLNKNSVMLSSKFSPKSTGLKGLFGNKKAMTVIGSLVVLVLLGLASGVVYYYVTYGELPTLTDSSAGRKLDCSKKVNQGKSQCSGTGATTPVATAGSNSKVSCKKDNGKYGVRPWKDTEVFVYTCKKTNNPNITYDNQKSPPTRAGYNCTSVESYNPKRYIKEIDMNKCN